MNTSPQTESRALPVAAHTPGPFSVLACTAPDGEGQAYSIGAIQEGEEHAREIAVVVPHENMEANARLIASAPELLAALESAVIALGGARSFIANSISKEASERLVETFPGLAQARAAIAKAKGEA